MKPTKEEIQKWLKDAPEDEPERYLINKAFEKGIIHQTDSKERLRKIMK